MGFRVWDFSTYSFAVCAMSISVEVGLLSGRTTTVNAGIDEKVETLIHRAQIALGVGKGRLMDSSGSQLDGSVVLKDSTVQNGDLLTLHIRRSAEVCASW